MMFTKVAFDILYKVLKFARNIIKKPIFESLATAQNELSTKGIMSDMFKTVTKKRGIK